MSSMSACIRRSSMAEVCAPEHLGWAVMLHDRETLKDLAIAPQDALQTTLIPEPEASGNNGDVDPAPDAFRDMGLQCPPQTTYTPISDVFDSMDFQYPSCTASSVRSASQLSLSCLLGGSDSDDNDPGAVGEVVPYVPFNTSPSVFLPEAPFRFASEEHHLVSSSAPTFVSHNALQLDVGLDPAAFAQSASVTVQQVITPASTRPSRVRTNDVTLQESSLYAGGTRPETDEDADDEEYVPSTRNTTRKRRRVARSSSHACHVPNKRPRPALPPRNVQLPLLPSFPPTSPRDIISLYISKENPWRCRCGWEQKNHRMPDLKRHIRTHMQEFEPARWVCCGVSLAQAPAHVSTLHPILHNGELRVGGCMAKFSRRDALRRHLQNENIHCIGEVVEQPLYTPLSV